MNELLEFFSLRDAIPLLLLIALLEFVGGQMGNSSTVSWWARGFAAAGFLLYAGLGIESFGPKTAGDFLTLGLQAVLAMGVLHGLARVTFPAVGFFYRHTWAKQMESHRAWMEEQARKSAQEQQAREAAERQQAELERQSEAERRRQEELANRPPPPTREQLRAEAKQSYDATLRILDTAGMDAIELQGARAQARRDYLRHIDEIMK